jgi:hypothetical protein
MVSSLNARRSLFARYGPIPMSSIFSMPLVLLLLLFATHGLAALLIRERHACTPDAFDLFCDGEFVFKSLWSIAPLHVLTICSAVSYPECMSSKATNSYLCNPQPNDRLRMLPDTDITSPTSRGFNVFGPKTPDGGFSLFRAALVTYSGSTDKYPCGPGTRLVIRFADATANLIDGLPGYFGVPNPQGLGYGVCPTCAHGTRCDDGYKGVGCCSEYPDNPTTRCRCPATWTSSRTGCNTPCQGRGQATCNDQGSCNGGTTTSAQGLPVPFTSGCTCSLGYFGATCEQTCSNGCNDAGDCVWLDGTARPSCLCRGTAAGPACTSSTANCGDPILCFDRGLCRQS